MVLTKRTERAAVEVAEEVQVSGAGRPAHCSPKLFVKSAKEDELAI